MRKLLILAMLVSTPAFADEHILPDPKITPGSTLQVSVNTMCSVGYSRKVRSVSERKKLDVYSEYGVQPHTGKYEMDHLISLELGGSNDVSNLWPQSYVTYPWNAIIKDRLENKLHQMVCDGKITLEQAQNEIATDWIMAYCKYFTDATESCTTYMKGMKK